MWRCNEKVSGGAGMTNAITVKERLKKQAIEDGKTMQDKLVTYGLERTIYRLSVSKYVEKFTLKGGIFLYTLFDGEYARATMDIDLLAQRIPNDAEEMTNVFNDIFSIECDDALRFDMNTLEVINITEFKETGMEIRHIFNKETDSEKLAMDKLLRIEREYERCHFKMN